MRLAFSELAGYTSAMTVYLRNPDRYSDVAREVDVNHFSFDYGRVRRQRIDVLKWGAMFLSARAEWEILVVAREGVAMYNQDSKSMARPVAVYPAWHMDDGWDALEDYCKNPVGNDPSLTDDTFVDRKFRPVKGQKHVVVIYSPPNISSRVGGAGLGRIMEIAKKYDVQILSHDTVSFRILFASGLGGGMPDPYQSARKGSILIPAGKCVAVSDMSNRLQWLRLLGYMKSELEGDEGLRMRLLYNIDSFHWAEKNYNRAVNFTLRATKGIDISTRDGREWLEDEHENFLTRGGQVQTVVPPLGEDDGYACDDCSLMQTCKFYREGMVCGVPKGKTHELAKEFGTRDASVIIDGLVKLQQIQASRLEKDLDEEEESGERTYDTDKRIKDLIDTGTKVAKLINPKLAGGGQTVNVGFMGQVGGVAIQQTPQELMASAVRALQDQGVAREDITEGMIRGLLEGVNNRAVMERTVEAEAEATRGPRVIEG